MLIKKIEKYLLQSSLVLYKIIDKVFKVQSYICFQLKLLNKNLLFIYKVYYIKQDFEKNNIMYY